MWSLGTIGWSPGKDGASGEGAAREGGYWDVLEKGDTSCERLLGTKGSLRAWCSQDTGVWVWVCVHVRGSQDGMRMVLLSSGTRKY